MSNLWRGTAPYPFEEISGITNVVYMRFGHLQNISVKTNVLFGRIWTLAEQFDIKNVVLRRFGHLADIFIVMNVVW
jgi:hypothetical protein